MDAQMQISIPVALKEWLDRQTLTKGFHTPSELVEDILRREQESEFRNSIDDQLRQSIASGEPTEFNAAEWERLRTLGRQLAARRPGP